MPKILYNLFDLISVQRLLFFAIALKYLNWAEPELELINEHVVVSVFQSGYWGRGAMDPEPGRCRRTDGKKWRCSRDVVAGQKYCERHVHRGRNRSRKPVEIPTPMTSVTSSTTTPTTIAGCGGTFKATTTVASGTPFALSGPSPSIDLLHLNQR